jgi:TRAP-type mannitol/chloroaromatic compound transport system permease large subunit
MGRRLPGKEVLAARVTPREAVLATTALIAVVALLGGVAAGYFYAVEAAAMAAFVLLIVGLATGRLRGAAMRDLLTDVMATTGALFGLLIAATTFTLVLRLLGTDRLVTEWIVALPGSEMVVTLTILAVIGLCAFVLDAFEIIFVVVPIVVPPLLVRVEDARWVAVLVLLTLQTSFLLPPFGYSLMMLRGRVGDRVPARAMLAALAPFLLAQWTVLATVLAFPNLVHLGQTKADASRAPEAPVSTEELERRLKDMILPLPPPD